jgi:hypothetical protein
MFFGHFSYETSHKPYEILKSRTENFKPQTRPYHTE